MSENITYSVENKDNTVYTDDGETRMLKKSDNNSNTNSKNIKNTIIKMENISDDEPTVIGDTSPMCWSTHNSNQNLQEEEEDLKKNEIINRIKEEKKIKKEKELIVQIEEVKKRKEAF